MYEVHEKILQVVIPAGITPSKRGIVISDRDSLEIISGCCGNFIRFVFDADKRDRNWYCVECGALSADWAHDRIPQSCMRNLDNARENLNSTANWIAAWTDAPVKDIEIFFD